MSSKEFLEEHYVKDVKFIATSTFAPQMVIEFLDGEKVTEYLRHNYLVDQESLDVFVREMIIKHEKNHLRRPKIEKILKNIG